MNMKGLDLSWFITLQQKMNASKKQKRAGKNFIKTEQAKNLFHAVIKTKKALQKTRCFVIQ